MKKFYLFITCLFGFLTTIHADGSVNAACLEKEKSLALLETAENLMKKAGVSFPSCSDNANPTDDAGCNRNLDSLAYIQLSNELISDIRKGFPNCSKPDPEDDKIVEDVKHRNCKEILESGNKKSGVYTIWSDESLFARKAFLVYCDMETDRGGWTVIQRRGKYPVQQDFYRDREGYRNGFGNVLEEFWLGNDNILGLCHKVQGCEIRFDLEDERGVKGFAHYQNFHYEGNTYRLRITGYTGNVADEMQNANNYEFSTKDWGNVGKAVRHKCGWWFGQSGYSANLNGIYQPGKTNDETVGWYDWRGKANLGKVEIKVRQK